MASVPPLRMPDSLRSSGRNAGAEPGPTRSLLASFLTCIPGTLDRERIGRLRGDREMGYKRGFVSWERRGLGLLCTGLLLAAPVSVLLQWALRNEPFPDLPVAGSPSQLELDF